MDNLVLVSIPLLVAAVKWVAAVAIVAACMLAIKDGLS